MKKKKLSLRSEKKENWKFHHSHFFGCGCDQNILHVVYSKLLFLFSFGLISGTKSGWKNFLTGKKFATSRPIPCEPNRTKIYTEPTFQFLNAHFASIYVKRLLQKHIYKSRKSIKGLTLQKIKSI